MPPLRKKGRGGGGGKTEAPLPGELPGTSPSVSVSLARKERERRIATTSGQGIENLGVSVSRSFQREKGEKKLLEASRTSLHLAPGTFQRSLRARKTEPTSTDSTPRVTDVSARREDREKRFSESAQRTSGYRSACRATREESSVCRTSCRELGDEKILYRRSVRAGEEKLVRRVGRRDEKTVEYATRYNSIYPGISAGKGVRESQSLDLKSDGSLITQRFDRGDDLNLSRASPSSPALRKSPRAEGLNATNTSPGVSLPVKSSCKCGVFRTSSDRGNSPGLQEKLGLIATEERRRGTSPIPTSREITVGRSDRKSRELSESVHGTPSLRSSSHNSGSATRANTPNLLHGRLALLEGRVSQIAAELKATKDLLDANNPACSKAVLTDIQLKITGIEKAINYRLARECGLVDQLEAEKLKGTYIQAKDVAIGRSLVESRNKSSGKGSKFVPSSEIVPHGQGMYGKVSKSVHSSKALVVNNTVRYEGISMSAAEKLSHIASLAGPRHRDPAILQFIDQSLFPAEVGGSAPASHVKAVFDQNEFEERLYPHQKLLRNRPTVHQKLMENRAALHQKLVENSVLLRNKLAALEERDGLNCGALDEGDIGAAEFISSLNAAPGARERDFERGKTLKGDPRALRIPVEAEDSFPFGLEHDGDLFMTKERRGSREGRRSSGSRKSFSGTPSDKTETQLVFHPLEKGSSGSKNERRRRSSEKRKSISTSECCSPEPIHGASQIVMLEPTCKLANNSKFPLPALSVDPNASEALDLECSEPFPDENLSHEGCVKNWLADVQDDGANAKSSTPCDEGAINLGCEESLTSEDATDDFQVFALPATEDDEKPYLGECEDNVPAERLHQVGHKVATAGWFMSEGEGILLAHDDGYCSFYDVANMEREAPPEVLLAPYLCLNAIASNNVTSLQISQMSTVSEGIPACTESLDVAGADKDTMDAVKANFKGPSNLPFGTWRDCWLIRAAGPDGASNKYIVAASVGSAIDSAFCSWDFYDRRITAFHSESSSPQGSPSSFSFRSSASNSPERRRLMSRDRQPAGCFSWYSGSENAQLLKGRTPSGPLSLDLVSGGSSSMGRSDSENLEIPLWWYRPCSPLLVSAGSGLKAVTLYDVRDGDAVMKWNLTKWIACMDYSSPIQWRNKGKIVVAEDQAISLWDVNSMTPERLQNISLGGKEIRALHVRNSDGECNGGVRQRLSSRDNISGDGVLCTQDAVNVLDFRVPSGIVLKIPTFGDIIHSVSANGDSVFAGVTSFNKAAKGNIQCKVNEWSIKQGRPMSVYKFPDSSAHQTHQSVAQVWGNSDTVMGVNGNGLFMFDSLKGALPGRDGGQSAREVLGTDDLVQPTFDYAGNRVLLISRDRPASWCHWL